MGETTQRVGLALIARNEQDTLPKLLASIEGAFDRVVLVDTGSTDRTVSLFKDWAASEASRARDTDRAFSWDYTRTEWTDDFGLHRSQADVLLIDGIHPGDDPADHTDCGPFVEWTCWADCDDTIEGATVLRELAQRAQPDVACFVADYDYATDQHGNVVCVLKRERLVRTGQGEWVGAVHEAQIITGGGSVTLDPRLCRWVHHKPWDAKPSSPRNLRILRKWVKAEPDNPRVLGYLGTEEAARGRHTRAVGYFRRYLKLRTDWDEERAQIHRKLAGSLLALDRTSEAREMALEALKVLPEWPDSYLTLAQASYMLGDAKHALAWANRVLELGQPDSLLILNPLDYTVEPWVVLAAAHHRLGNDQQALDFAHKALGQVPDHPTANAVAQACQVALKRDQTASTVCALARVLVEHDEQLKALRLLEQSVPYYVVDHPEVVALRSWVRERVQPLLEPAGQADHYYEATEIGLPDLEVVAQLPRAHFLADGIREQQDGLAA